MDLEGCTALVTGGAKRLGLAIVEALAKAGVHVVVHTHTSDATTALAVCKEHGVKAWHVQGDLREPEALFAKAVAAASRIDLLVNNASTFAKGGLDAPLAQWLDDLHVNALGPHLLTRAWLKQDPAPLACVSLLDSRITDQDDAHVPYILAKKALSELVRLNALDAAPVRINAVAPGPILPAKGDSQADLERIQRTLPLQNGNVEDVTAAVLHLLRAGYTTGQTLYVDGGRHARRM